MGFLDVLKGMQNGPHGGSSSAPGSSGMSPITMGLLALLAYKAWQAHSSSAGVPAPTNAGSGSLGSGGLGDILGGLFGGRAGSPAGSNWLTPLTTGGGLGAVISEGLRKLVGDMQSNPNNRAAQSWVSTGPNEDISENDLARTLGPDTLNALTEKTGMTREQLLKALRTALPDAVNELTPDGRLPTQQELSQRI
jgi:uncharacterized protein YidB (DUF937 family)